MFVFISLCYVSFLFYLFMPCYFFIYVVCVCSFLLFVCLYFPVFWLVWHEGEHEIMDNFNSARWLPLLVSTVFIHPVLVLKLSNTDSLTGFYNGSHYREQSSTTDVHGEIEAKKFWWWCNMILRQTRGVNLNEFFQHL